MQQITSACRKLLEIDVIPKPENRPALLGEVSGGRSRTTTRLSPALFSTWDICSVWRGTNMIRSVFPSADRATQRLHNRRCRQAGVTRSCPAVKAHTGAHGGARWQTLLTGRSGRLESKGTVHLPLAKADEPSPSYFYNYWQDRNPEVAKALPLKRGPGRSSRRRPSPQRRYRRSVHRTWAKQFQLFTTMRLPCRTTGRILVKRERAF